MIRVKDHKTGQQGSAKLTLDAYLQRKLKQYYTHIRPRLAMPGHDINRLFIMPGSRQVSKISILEDLLGAALGVRVPCSSDARKIGATFAAQQLGYTENRLVCTQMSHGPAVSQKYYEAVRGTSHAAAAIKTMEKLRTQAQSAPPPPSTPVFTAKWSPEDTETVKRKFRKHIENTTQGKRGGFTSSKL